MTPDPEVPLFLGPAELLVTRGPRRVKTILGSCVAIAMRSPRLGIASMAHCLLPVAERAAGALSRSEALRYVDSTIQLMLHEFALRGVGLNELEILVFGGADSFRSPYGVGRRNVETAVRVLAALGVHLPSGNLGGRHGRVVEFNTGTGEAVVKKLPTLAATRHREGV